MKITKVKSVIASASLSLLMAGGAWAAGLEARVNTDRIARGDTFQLILSVNGQGHEAPDLSPLHTEFDVLGTSQSSQTQVVNGRMSQTQSWAITLSPRAEGAITIPELNAGPLSSEPLQVSVVKASALPEMEGTSGISVQAEIGSGSHYVFQEIPVIVRIETAQPLQRAELIAPTGDFELARTGPDRASQISRDGETLNVIERTYLLRPERAGTLELAPFVLRGTLPDPNTRADPFERFGFGSSMFDQMMGGSLPGGTPFAARSDALSLDVAANPNAGSTGWFLPAQAVELTADWHPDAPVFREGEAVTRRVSILALGARPEQLPDLAFEEPEGARIYLDDSSIDLVEAEQGTIARRDFLISVVPTRGGDITLPAIALEWFDITSDQTRQAVLPELTIRVESTVPVTLLPPAVTAPGSTVPADRVIGPGLWVIGGVAAAMLLAGYFLASRRNRAMARPQAATSKQDWLKLAKAGDVMVFYQALLAARSVSSGHDATELDRAISEIERFAFSPHDTLQLPDLAVIANRLSGTRGKRAFGKTRAGVALPDLYPGE